MRSFIAALALTTAVAAAPAYAAASIGNTGFDTNWKAGYVNNSGSEPSQTDISNTSTSTASVVTKPDQFWVQGDTNVSKWVSTDVSGGGSPGWYVYSNSFTAAANDVLNFNYAVDDKLVKVLLNGNYVGSNWGGTYDSFTSGSISGLAAGSNTLTFLISNNVPGGSNPTNPTAFRFESTSGSVPEPATWAMMLVGFGMVGATVRFRRRNGNVAHA